MHFRWVAILGLALGMTGQSAEAARVERGPVARPSAARPAPLARPVVAPARANARPASTARGGHVSRTSEPRLGASRSNARVSGPSVGREAGRERGVIVRRAGNGRFATTAGRERGVVASRGTGRYAVAQGRQQRGVATRGSLNGGYQNAMLRGPGGRFAGMSACSTVRGRRVCGGTRTVAMRWSGGLAPAAGIQSSCPDGTMATLAVGHENVVRCVPM